MGMDDLRIAVGMLNLCLSLMELAEQEQNNALVMSARAAALDFAAVVEQILPDIRQPHGKKL
jgi:hypothetical protein